MVRLLIVILVVIYLFSYFIAMENKGAEYSKCMKIAENDDKCTCYSNKIISIMGGNTVSGINIIISSDKEINNDIRNAALKACQIKTNIN